MDILKDEDWLRQSFMVPTKEFDEREQYARTFTVASFKFTDTTLGGNFAINPPPQFCRHADVRVEGRYAAANADGGAMGRYYSDALDDNSQVVHMSFGVPKFSGLFAYFSRFYSADAGLLANRGRMRSVTYMIGNAVGFIVTIVPQLIIKIDQMWKMNAESASTKYYYMKPAMPLYWNAVSVVANGIGVNMGIVARGMGEGEDKVRQHINEASNLGKQEHNKLFENLGNFYPNIFNSSGGIDIMQMATRAQRLAMAQREKIRQDLESQSTMDGLADAIRSLATMQVDDDGGWGSTKDMVDMYHSSELTQPPDEETNTISEISTNVENPHSEYADDTSFISYSKAELARGSRYVGFRVDYTGSHSESFSNSVGESSLASTLNQISSSARSTRFNFADFVLFADGNFGSIVNNVLTGVRDTVAGFLDSVHLGGLLALGGSAFADIPKVWQGSTCNLPSASYTMQLRSPYGNLYSRYFNLIVPLSMILAGCLPLSTGRQSWTSPFLCEAYCRGRSLTRLGMIESVNISRGEGNVGWTEDGAPLGIDVSFTIVDLSTLIHMPITANYTAMDALMDVAGLGRFSKEIYNDENAYTDYLAVLGSLGFEDTFYPQNKIRLRRAMRQLNYEHWKSKARVANTLFGSNTAHIIANFANFKGDRE